MRNHDPRPDLVEEIVRELRLRRASLERLFAEPGQLVIHVNPKAKCTDRVRIEARVKV
jgi:hypothetical protein